MDYPDSIDDIQGSRIVEENSDYEIIIEPDPNYPKEANLSLYIRDHTDNKDIVPDDVMDCDLYESPTDPTTISELPTKYREAFESAVETLEDKYGYMPQNIGGNLGLCTTCIPPDHMLVVTGSFKEV